MTFTGSSPAASGAAGRGPGGGRAATSRCSLPPTCGETSRPGASHSGLSSGSGSGSTTSSGRGDPPGAQRGDAGRRCRRPAPRATLTSSAPSFIRPRKSRVDQAAGLVGQRARRARRRPRRAAASGSSAIGVHAVAGRPRDPHHLALERQQPRLDRRARSRRTRRSGPACRPARGASRPCQLVPVLGAHEARARRAATARMRVSASSAVEVSWMPRPLHSEHAVGDVRRGRCRRRRSASARPRARSSAAITSVTAGAEPVRRHVEPRRRRRCRARRSVGSTTS